MDFLTFVIILRTWEFHCMSIFCILKYFKYFLQGYPHEFVAYLKHCRNLRFEETPDYTFLRQLFRKLYRKNFEHYDFQFDWKDPILLKQREAEKLETKIREEREREAQIGKAHKGRFLGSIPTKSSYFLSFSCCYNNINLTHLYWYITKVGPSGILRRTSRDTAGRRVLRPRGEGTWRVMRRGVGTKNGRSEVTGTEAIVIINIITRANKTT